MLLELVYPVSSTQLPIIPETKRMPKLIWFDTGLVNYQAGIRKEIIGSTDMVDSWRGHIAEQITAQELLALEDRVGQHRSFGQSRITVQRLISFLLITPSFIR